MNLLSQDSLISILSLSFAAFGILLIFFLIITKIVNFYLTTFAKKKTNPVEKTFLIPLAGVCFIAVLTMLASNWFIYAIAIIIIATLITELEFLEKLMALLWNRKDYWQYQVERMKQPQQPSTKSPEEKKQLEGMGKQLEKTEVNSSTPPMQNNWFFQFHSERVYRLIFGSQIGLLQYLEMQAEKGLNKSEVESLYWRNPLSNTYPFEHYIGFLINNQLIRYNITTNSYHILPVGKFFLRYITENQIPTNKPN